jgi:hypothetical protein
MTGFPDMVVRMAESPGHFDADEYGRQLERGVEDLES